MIIYQLPLLDHGMYKKFTIIFFLFIFMISSIPDSLGCQSCLGRPVKSPGVNPLNPLVAAEPPDPVPGKAWSDQTVPPDQKKSAPCHFCCLETAASPVGFSLPRPLLFSHTGQIVVSNPGDLIFPITQPPEKLSAVLL